MAATSTSMSTNKTTSFNNTIEECLSSLAEMDIGDHSSASSSKEHKSEYFSTRIEEMMQSKSQFPSIVEHDIEQSKVYWSEVPGLSELSDDSDFKEEVRRENREVFVELLNDLQWIDQYQARFFREWPHSWELGRKIAEGGQASIFEVLDENGCVNNDSVVKVFKSGTRLSDLKKQWPDGIVQQKRFLQVVYKGTLMDDGRFVFWMARCWGDLRKLIDQAMQEKNNQGPPFPYEWNGETLLLENILTAIAFHMHLIHEEGIIHRDLKAANILLMTNLDDGHAVVLVADFECSIGVIGTGFWRAPEILLALKNGSVPNYSEKADVYSYGMVCYEVVTGRLPFEGELEACRASNDLIIDGRRPKLPSDLNVGLKNLIERCWNPIPNERPSFVEIFAEVVEALC